MDGVVALLAYFPGLGRQCGQFLYIVDGTMLM